MNTSQIQFALTRLAYHTICLISIISAGSVCAQDIAPVRPPVDLSGPLKAKSISVRWAGYGIGDDWVDLTAYCRDQLKGRGFIKCNTKALRKYAPPTEKRGTHEIILLLDTVGGPVRLRLTEGGFVSANVSSRDLPPVGPGRRWTPSQLERANRLISQPDSGIDVIWAYWGSGRFGRSLWVDLTEQLGQQLETRPFKSAKHGLKAGVPDPRLDRVTRMILSCGGEAMYVLLPNNSEINTQPNEQQIERPWQLRDWQPPAFAHKAADMTAVGNALQWGLSSAGKAVFAVHPETKQWAKLDPDTLDLIATKSPEAAQKSGWHIAPRVQITDGSIEGSAYSDYTLLDDSRYILQSGGVIVANRLNNRRERERFSPQTLPQNYGAVANRDLGVLAVFCRNQIKLYTWPELAVIQDIVFAGTLVDPRVIEGSTVFYARCLKQPTVTERGKLTLDDSIGRIMRIDLRDLLPGELSTPRNRLSPLRNEATGHPNIALRLPLRSDLTDIAYSADGQAAYLLNAGAGRVYRINPQTLKVTAQSARLPAGTHRISLSPSGKHLWLACAPTAYAHNKDNPGGTILKLDTADLSKKPMTYKVNGIDPYDIAVTGTDRDTRVFVTDGSNQWTNMIEFSGQPLKEKQRIRISQGALITPSPRGSLMLVGGRQKLGYITLASRHNASVRDLSRGESGMSYGQIYLSSDGTYLMTEGSDLLELRYVGKHRAAVILKGHIGPRDKKWFPQPLDLIAGMERCAGHVVVCDRKGQLWRIDPQTLQATPGPAFEGIMTEMRFDQQSQRLIAIYRHGAEVSNHGSYKRPIDAELVSIDLTTWLSGIHSETGAPVDAGTKVPES